MTHLSKCSWISATFWSSWSDSNWAGRWASTDIVWNSACTPRRYKDRIMTLQANIACLHALICRKTASKEMKATCAFADIWCSPCKQINRWSQIDVSSASIRYLVCLLCQSGSTHACSSRCTLSSQSLWFCSSGIYVHGYPKNRKWNRKEAWPACKDQTLQVEQGVQIAQNCWWMSAKSWSHDVSSRSWDCEEASIASIISCYKLTNCIRPCNLPMAAGGLYTADNALHKCLGWTSPWMCSVTRISWRTVSLLTREAQYSPSSRSILLLAKRFDNDVTVLW